MLLRKFKFRSSLYLSDSVISILQSMVSVAIVFVDTMVGNNYAHRFIGYATDTFVFENIREPQPPGC